MTDELILEYSKYIYGISKHFRNYPNKEDLFQVGCIGLINAYNNYDPFVGAKFTTYAYPYIIGEMYKLVREDKGIKISNNFSKLTLKIEKATLLLAQKLYRYPTTKEVADFLGVSEIDIIESMKSTSPISSIDESIYNDGKDITLHDMVSNNEMDMNTLVALKQELSSLTKEERTILEKNIYYDYTQQEIADSLGINQVQVSRKLNKIKSKIMQNVA